MNKLLLILLLALPAYGKNLIITMASNNLAVTYSTSSTYTLKGLTFKDQNLYVSNGCATRVCFNYTTASLTTAPTAGNGNEICIAGASQATFLRLPIQTNVWFRADVATCSAGVLDAGTWESRP